VNCSTLRERTAGSPPSTSQVSLQALVVKFLIGPTREKIGHSVLWLCLLSRRSLQSKVPGRAACKVSWPRMHVAIGSRRWAEAHIKIARMTLTIKLDRNWNSFQLANRAPPLSVTDSSIAPCPFRKDACNPARPPHYLNAETSQGNQAVTLGTQTTERRELCDVRLQARRPQTQAAGACRLRAMPRSRNKTSWHTGHVHGAPRHDAQAPTQE